MAPQKSFEAAKQAVAVAKEATDRLFPKWRLTSHDIRSEITAQGLSVNPDDLLTLLGNAEAKDEHYTQLQQWLQEDMSIDDPVAAALVAGYEDLMADREELQAELDLKTPEAEIVKAQLQALMQERPNEVMSFFAWEYEGKFREATDKKIKEMREMIDGVIEKIKPQRDKILATLREELKLEDFTKKFEFYCSMAILRADMAQERHDALSVRTQHLRATLKERESIIKSLMAQAPAADTTGLQTRIDGLLSELEGQKEAQSRLADMTAFQKEVLVERKATIDKLENKNKSLKDAQEKSTRAIQDKDEAFGRLQEQLGEARTILSNKEGELGEKQEQLLEAQSTLSNKNNELDKLQKQLHEAQATISNKEDELSETREQLHGAQATISSKEDELVEKREQLEKVSKAKSDLETTNRELDNHVKQKDAEISRLTDAKSAADAAKDTIARQGTEKDREISRLMEAEQTAKDALVRQDTKKDQEISRLRQAEQTAKDNLAKQVNDKDEEIIRLKQTCEEHLDALATKSQEIESLKQSEKAAKEALQGRIDDLAQNDQEIRELRSSLDIAQNETRDKERDRLLIESALTTARDAITRKDAEIADLRSSGQTASDEKAKLVDHVAEKDRMIEGLNDAARQYRTKISDLEEKIERLEQAATAVDNAHVNAIREKNKRIDELAAAAETQQRKITNLEEEVKQRKAAYIYAMSALVVMVADSCNIDGTYINEGTFSLIDELCVDSAAIEMTETDALLPSLRFSPADNTRPVMAHLLCLCFRLLPGLAGTGISRHAQSMFDEASKSRHMVPWIRHILFRLGDLLESGDGSIHMARLCLIALQGVVLLDSPTCLGTDPERTNELVDRVRNWIQNNTTSTCLRFMMGQLDARLARLSPNGALPWLSGYPSGNHHLDATNSSLPAGTHLIADESGLFFLVEPDAVLVFTADDIDRVTWDLGGPRDPLTLHFAADSVLRARSLVISLDESSGRPFQWYADHLRYKFGRI